jgi:hypothetical protein
MDHKTLREIRGRCEAATHGQRSWVMRTLHRALYRGTPPTLVAAVFTEPDYGFFYHALEDVEKLLDYVDDLREAEAEERSGRLDAEAEVTRLRAALERIGERAGHWLSEPEAPDTGDLTLLATEVEWALGQDA